MSYATMRGREGMTQDRLMAQAIAEQRPESPLKALQKWIDEAEGRDRELTTQVNGWAEAIHEWHSATEAFQREARKQMQLQAEIIELLRQRVTQLETKKKKGKR